MKFKAALCGWRAVAIVVIDWTFNSKPKFFFLQSNFKMGLKVFKFGFSMLCVGDLKC